MREGGVQSDGSLLHEYNYGRNRCNRIASSTAKRKRSYVLMAIRELYCISVSAGRYVGHTVYKSGKRFADVV